ncbi:uncharacterized protein [Aegilops tauschii subsp. strangulata]|uniref:uncharacterized protein isoform X3 n=1 Tax=Aegilops tauschii subsp. strangulata TaxID=200361 RepID=UPI003CC8C2D5
MVEQNPEDAGRPGVLIQLPLFLLCGLSAAIAAQETCRADIDAKCGDAAPMIVRASSSRALPRSTMRVQLARGRLLTSGIT